MLNTMFRLTMEPPAMRQRIISPLLTQVNIISAMGVAGMSEGKSPRA